MEAYRQTKAGQHEEEEEYDSPSLGEEQGQEGQEEETENEREEVHMAVHRMAIPMASRASEEVLRHIIDLYLMLRPMGMRCDRSIQTERQSSYHRDLNGGAAKEISCRPGRQEPSLNQTAEQREQRRRSNQE